MNIILFDDKSYHHLRPFTYTRPVCELRIGILTIREKWELALKSPISYYTKAYLSSKYATKYDETQNCLINGSVLPTPSLCQQILDLPLFSALVQGDVVVALKLPQERSTWFFENGLPKMVHTIATQEKFIKINHTWDIFTHNDAAIKADFQQLTQGRDSQKLSDSNCVIGDASRIFLEEGAWVEGATLNTQSGPIYIGKKATVMEGGLIRGSFALGEEAVVKMGAKIYGATTIGQHCKVGGEISNSVLFGFSNKAHDGFLGNSVIGEWCNLGADTNNSNLKNNYSNVELWSYPDGRFVDTGLQFCGLMMGDHSKCGINTMFNTGTTVGVSVNYFGEGFPRKFIPSFVWGGHNGFATYQLTKAIDTARLVLQRRQLELSSVDIDILTHIFEETKGERPWEIF